MDDEMTTEEFTRLMEEVLWEPSDSQRAASREAMEEMGRKAMLRREQRVIEAIEKICKC